LGWSSLSLQAGGLAKQTDWKFGVYAVFELAYRQQDETFLSGVLFAYYDGISSDSGEKLRSLDAATKYASKQGFHIIYGGAQDE
jgi:hypothetical protein